MGGPALSLGQQQAHVRFRRKISATSHAVGPPISDDRAIELATAAIAGRITPQAGGPVHLARRAGEIVVEFRRNDPPGTRGPDFDARVVLDEVSGEVRSLLGGS